MSQAFFDYPDQEDSSAMQELVLLAHWDDAKWRALVKFTELRRFKQGDLVIRQGDTDRAFYIIISGQLEVLIAKGANNNSNSQWRRAHVSEAGSAIGEQAFLDGKPRSATLRALTDGEMLCVSNDAFHVLAAQQPELARDVLFELARTLSVKLRKANGLIATLVK